MLLLLTLRKEPKKIFCGIRLQFWDEGLPGVSDAFQGSLSPESLGALNVWGGSETLTWVHPLDFATKMAQVSKLFSSLSLHSLTFFPDLKICNTCSYHPFE